MELGTLTKGANTVTVKILLACEQSGTVRDEFARRGHDAWSCDLLPSDTPGQHYRGDVRDILYEAWDMVIAFPPCTYLTVTANKWMKPEYRDRFPDRPAQRQAAIDFFMLFVNAPARHIAIENPVGIMSTVYRKPDQILQPYQFGHPETKATCLWLKNLPPLRETQNVGARAFALPERERMRLHYLPPSPDRAMLRSKTFVGVARAMAEQWGDVTARQLELTERTGR